MPQCADFGSFAFLHAFGLRAAIAQAQGPAEREIDVLDDNVQPQPQGRLQHFLPGALSVEMDASTAAVGTGWAGYNSASSMPVFNATAEAWIVPRVSVVAGFRFDGAGSQREAREPRVAHGSWFSIKGGMA